MYASIDSNGQENDFEENAMSFSYSAKFNTNMLIIGSTGTGKISYVEHILENGFVQGDELIWLSN